MRVRVLDGSEAAGMRLLAAVVEHAERVPGGGWSFSAAQRALVDSEGAVWTLSEGGAAVERLVFLSCPCECGEVTEYRDGEEISRCVGPTG